MSRSATTLVRIAAALAFVSLIIPAVAPVAVADPLTLYHLGVDRGLGKIREDDQMVVDAAYNGLHGLAQRASDRSGTGDPGNGLANGWGDGSLILDSQWFASAGGAFMSSNLAVADEARGCGQCIWPGHGQFFAWHGKWNDFNGNGVVDDVHDKSAAASDEFRWEGASSGASFTMPLWLLPFQAGFNTDLQGNLVIIPPTGTGLVATQNRSSEAADGFFVDLTAQASEQGWVTRTNTVFAGHTFVDGGLLMTMWSIAAANATVMPGTVRGYDLEGSGLVDVDRYSAISPDIEAAYMSFTAASYPTVRDTYRYVLDTRAGLPGTAEANAARDEALREANTFLVSPIAREPNTAFDVYPGATWGGATDARGTGSDFSEYAAGWHLWADTNHGITIPLPAHADGGPSGVTYGKHDAINLYYDPLPSASSAGNEQYGFKPGFATFATRIALWHDANHDKWLQEVCDPEDAGEWDGGVGECRDPYRGGATSNPQSLQAAPTRETFAACELTNAKIAKVTLTPLAPWGGVMVINNIGGPTSSVWEGEYVSGPHVGMEVIELPNMPHCVFDHQTSTRHALFLPAGAFTTPVIMQTQVSLAQRVSDPGRGIDVPAGETVIDVDFIAPNL